jgi:endonuclease/exonuclease/phosphatase family metal-dependent hydrolase
MARDEPFSGPVTPSCDDGGVARVRAFLAVVAVLVALGVAGDGATTPYRHTYLQFNLCGNACNNGGRDVVARLVDAVRDGRPTVVTLNELCENQYRWLRDGLSGYIGRFDPTGPTCRNGFRYGNAVLAHTRSLEVVGGWGLPNPAGDELRRLLCVRLDTPLLVCVTHISNEAGNIAPQVAAVVDVLNGLPRDVPLVVGGDFNTDPASPALDPLYRPGLVEVDSVGQGRVVDQPHHDDILNEDTYGGHKYDYLFLSDGDWTSVTADVSEVGLSDHDALWATATLRVPPPRRS